MKEAQQPLDPICSRLFEMRLKRWNLDKAVAVTEIVFKFHSNLRLMAFF
jgi:hypothetical protein